MRETKIVEVKQHTILAVDTLILFSHICLEDFIIKTIYTG